MKINRFYAGTICSEKLFFSSRDINGLFSYDLRDKVLEHIGTFENEILLGKILHRDCFIYEDEIIFIPQEAENIHVYNYKNNRNRIIPIPKRKWPPVGHIFDDKSGCLWVFPALFSDGILKINLHTCEVTKVAIVPRFSESDRFNDAIFHRIAITDTCVVAPSINDGIIYCFYIDRLNNKVEYNTKQIDIRIKGAFLGNKGVWLSSSNENTIYKYDYTQNRIVGEYDLSKANIHNEKNGLSNIIETEKNIITIPAWSEEIVILNEQGYVDCRYAFSKFLYDPGKPLFIRSNVIGNKIYISPSNIDQMVVINMESLDMELISIPEIEINKIKDPKLVLGHMQKEGELISLQEFLDLI